MDLKQLALEILNNDCPRTRADEAGVIEHWIELHCLWLKLKVRVISRDAEGLPSDYEVLSYSWEDN